MTESNTPDDLEAQIAAEEEQRRKRQLRMEKMLKCSHCLHHLMNLDYFRSSEGENYWAFGWFDELVGNRPPPQEIHLMEGDPLPSFISTPYPEDIFSAIPEYFLRENAPGAWRERHILEPMCLKPLNAVLDAMLEDNEGQGVAKALLSANATIPKLESLKNRAHPEARSAFDDLIIAYKAVFSTLTRGCAGG